MHRPVTIVPEPSESGASEHEILQNFFQSLLGSRTDTQGAVGLHGETSVSAPDSNSEAPQPTSERE